MEIPNWWVMPEFVSCEWRRTPARLQGSCIHWWQTAMLHTPGMWRTWAPMTLAGIALAKTTFRQALQVPGSTRRRLSSGEDCSGAKQGSTEEEALRWSLARIYQMQAGIYHRINQSLTEGENHFFSHLKLYSQRPLWVDTVFPSAKMGQLVLLSEPVEQKMFVHFFFLVQTTSTTCRIK